MSETCSRGLCDDEAEVEVLVHENEWRPYCEEDGEVEHDLQQNSDNETGIRQLE